MPLYTLTCQFANTDDADVSLFVLKMLHAKKNMWVGEAFDHFWQCAADVQEMLDLKARIFRFLVKIWMLKSTQNGHKGDQCGNFKQCLSGTVLAFI